MSQYTLHRSQGKGGGLEWRKLSPHNWQWTRHCTGKWGGSQSTRSLVLASTTWPWSVGGDRGSGAKISPRFPPSSSVSAKLPPLANWRHQHQQWAARLQTAGFCEDPSWRQPRWSVMCRAGNDEIREVFTMFGGGPFSLLKTRTFKLCGQVSEYLNSLNCEKHRKHSLSALVIRNVGGWMWLLWHSWHISISTISDWFQLTRDTITPLKLCVIAIINGIDEFYARQNMYFKIAFLIKCLFR